MNGEKVSGAGAKETIQTSFVCPWLCGFLSDLLEGDMESGVPSWAGDLCFGLFLEAFLPRVREPQSRFSPVVSLP